MPPFSQAAGLAQGNWDLPPFRSPTPLQPEHSSDRDDKNTASNNLRMDRENGAASGTCQAKDNHFSGFYKKNFYIHKETLAS
jgi:hypothetical protein